MWPGVAQVDKDLVGFVAYASELVESEAGGPGPAAPDVATVRTLLALAQRCLAEGTDRFRHSIQGIVDQLEVRARRLVLQAAWDCAVRKAMIQHPGMGSGFSAAEAFPAWGELRIRRRAICKLTQGNRLQCWGFAEA